jgi:beta-galactosidase
MSPKRYPKGFLWGTATSAFQVEMGRGPPAKESDWYAWVHDGDNIAAGRVSGDTPLDGPGAWELYVEDFRIAREELGNNSIRLSLDWSRLFPRSTETVYVDVKRDEHGNVFDVSIDEATMRDLKALADSTAVERYREMLSEANRVGLTVFLTLYHWPIPLWLHDPITCRDDLEGATRRGWQDQSTIVEFAKYAAFVAHAFGDLVDLYATINEPRIVSQHSYMTERGEFPPGLNDPEPFRVSLKNFALAHGVAYDQVKHWDRTSISDKGPATVGIVVVLMHYEPADSSSPEDVSACDFVRYTYNEWYLNAIIKGDYDLDLDRLIQPDEQWPHTVKGCDFIGVNYYARWLVKHAEKGWGLFDYAISVGERELSEYGWETFPQGLRHSLEWCYDHYRRPIYITENGLADSTGERRTRYLLDHLEVLHDAIQGGVPVMGYFHWSLLDNFEWADGFKIPFGLYRVERETKERIPTETVAVYREIAVNNALPK